MGLSQQSGMDSEADNHNRNEQHSHCTAPAASLDKFAPLTLSILLHIKDFLFCQKQKKTAKNLSATKLLMFLSDMTDPDKSYNRPLFSSSTQAV